MRRVHFRTSGGLIINDPIVPTKGGSWGCQVTIETPGEWREQEKCHVGKK
jgi:hypothetical protein